MKPMKLSSLFIAPLLLAGAAVAQTPPASAPRGETTANVATGPRIILVGDSTMAPRSGYGNALCARVQQVACINLARGGRSSKSFRAEGLWDTVLALLNEGGAAKQKTLVLIQFGHNDQPGKPGRSTDLATEFGHNMTGVTGALGTFTPTGSGGSAPFACLRAT